MLEARDLVCRRAGRQVFEGLGFVLRAGEAMLLRGPNGCGKSSLLRILAGLLPAAAGELLWEGRAADPRGVEHRARLHFIGHADAAKPALTVRENLAFAAALAGSAAVPEEALEAFDLAELADLPARYLSSGQKRRLALSRLLLAPRPLWLLDEPGVGVDRANRVRLERCIEAHLADGGLCVIASHGDVEMEAALVLDFEEAA